MLCFFLGFGGYGLDSESVFEEDLGKEKLYVDDDERKYYVVDVEDDGKI